MAVFKTAVVGAGTMGVEIAMVIANAGIPVVLRDRKQARVDAGLKKIGGKFQKRVEKGKMTQEDCERKLGLVEGTVSYEPFGDVDLVIESVAESMKVKHMVFGELDEATPGRAIFASNTSALSITEIGRATSRPERFLGLHFFNPASVMKLVEVIHGEDTSEETAVTAYSFIQNIRKMPIRCKEVPGFVVNRVLMSAMSEVWRFQEETGIPEADLDKAIAEAKAAPMGPFVLADMVGLDIVLHTAEEMHTHYPDRNFVSHHLRDLVSEGKLGLKTGQGFYPYGK